nr:2A [Passerivirus A1]
AGGILRTSPEPCFVIRNQRLTYVHWALRSGNKQVSIQRSGLGGLTPVIGYEDLEGEVYAEVPPHIFALAEAQVGSEYPYSATNNCTTWVETLTNLSLPNTGNSLALGLGAIGVGAAAALAVKTAEAKKQ